MMRMEVLGHWGDCENLCSSFVELMLRVDVVLGRGRRGGTQIPLGTGLKAVPQKADPAESKMQPDFWYQII